MVDLDQETLQEIRLMVRDLINKPPIFFDEDEEQYFCQCCFSSIAKTPDTIQTNDEETFPHRETCPVTRAQRIEVKLKDGKQ